MEKKQRVFWIVALAAVLFSLCIGAVGGLLIGGVTGFMIGRARVQSASPVGPGLETRPWQPVTPVPLPQDPSAPLLQGGSGALIVWVEPDTPAEEAGLQPGDIIVAVDGEPVSASRPLPDLIAQYRPGKRVMLTVLRGAAERQVEVKLANHPDQPGRGYLGVRVQSLGEQPSRAVP